MKTMIDYQTFCNNGNVHRKNYSVLFDVVHWSVSILVKKRNISALQSNSFSLQCSLFGSAENIKRTPDYRNTRSTWSWDYWQRLEFLNLPTLTFRRNRGDRIEVYKILTGKYDPTLPSILHRIINSTTRGNPLKLCTYRPKYDLCKYNFTVRVISLWNSLPTHVITAVSVDSFKNRLDKFWANEEARFDYKANLSGSGFARCF